MLGNLISLPATSICCEKHKLIRDQYIPIIKIYFVIIEKFDRFKKIYKNHRLFEYPEYQSTIQSFIFRIRYME